MSAFSNGGRGWLRSLIAPVGLSALALCLLVSCSSAERDGLDIQASPYIKPAYEQLARAFADSHVGMPVRYTAGPREESQMVQQLLRTQLVGGELPDVAFVSGNFVRLLADRGLAVALDDFMAADEEWQQGGFAPALSKVGQVGSATYGLGFGISMPVVLFNSELVRRAGGDPHALPASWQGIVALARKMNDPKAGVVGGFLEYDNGGAYSFLFLLESHGGHFAAADEHHVGFDDEHGLQALEVLRDFGEAGQAHADMTRDQARQAFGSGGIGVFVTMSSTLPRIEQAASGRFEVLSVPLPLEAGGRVPAAGPVAVMLARDPARQRAAFELMKFACGPAGQLILADASGYAPANEAAIRNSEPLRAVLASRTNANAYLARLDEATRWYAAPGPNSTRISDAVITLLQQVVTLETQPPDALMALAEEVNGLLPQQTASAGRAETRVPGTAEQGTP